MVNKRLIIGVTGGIACGKSEVCRILEKKGFLHIDADAVCHEILEDPEIISRICEEFGDDIIMDGKILRGKLGTKVFASPEKLARLEEIEVPKILERIRQIVSNTDRSVVIEAVKLISSGLNRICDFVWYIEVDPETQLARLMYNRGMPEEQARLRLETQMMNDWDMEKIDFVIRSDVPLDQMSVRVDEVLSLCYNRL